MFGILQPRRMIHYSATYAQGTFFSVSISSMWQSLGTRQYRGHGSRIRQAPGAGGSLLHWPGACRIRMDPPGYLEFVYRPRIADRLGSLALALFSLLTGKTPLALILANLVLLVGGVRAVCTPNVNAIIGGGREMVLRGE